DLLLQVLGELFVAFGGNDREGVDIEAAQAFALLVDAQAQATADGLPALALGTHLAQSANLKHVRVIPALAQGGVREDEFELGIEAQKLLLVAHNEVVGVVVGLRIAASVLELLNSSTADFLLVD